MFVEEIYHIEKKLNIHFDGHNSSTNEPFTIFILRCVFQFYKDGTGDPNISHLFLKNQGIEKIQ